MDRIAQRLAYGDCEFDPPDLGPREINTADDRPVRLTGRRAISQSAEQRTSAWVSPRVAADLTGRTLAYIQQGVADGTIRIRTIGRAIYVDLDSVEVRR